MRVSKWVDMGQEVEIEIGMEEIRAALSECFAVVTDDRLGEEGPNRAEVAYALNSVGTFLNALTIEHIGKLNSAQRETIRIFLLTQAERFKEPR